MLDLKDFRKALHSVVGCSSKKSSLPALRNFQFYKGRVTCSDGQVISSASFELGADGLLDAEGLSLWLKGLPSSETEVAVESEGPSLRFTAGKYSVLFGRHPASEFEPYEIPQSTVPGVVLDRAETVTALKLCKSCIKSDFSEQLSGLFIEWDGKGNVLFRSTDGIAAIEITLAATTEEPIPAATACVPSDTIDALLRSGGISEIVFPSGDFDPDDAVVWFRSSTLIRSRTRPAPEALSLVKILDKCQGDYDMLEVTKDLCAAFDAVAPVACTTKDHQMQATIWDGSIEFVASSETIVEARASAAVAHEELDVARVVMFSAAVLKGFLDYIDDIHFPESKVGHILVKSDCVRGVMALIRS